MVFSACSCNDPAPCEGDACPDNDGGADSSMPEFVCRSADDKTCVGSTHYTCNRVGEFLQPEQKNCALDGLVCDDELGCVVCPPDRVGCDENGDAAKCEPDGSKWNLIDDCDESIGEVCNAGQCLDSCVVAQMNRSYVGCEFFAADLDNASLGLGRDASAQQYAVVVSNVDSAYPANVTVEINDAPFGAPPQIREIMSASVPAADLEVFRLPRREVDGSSSNQQCFSVSDECPLSESCQCPDGPEDLCFCRNSASATGMNDGTHSAITAQAFRISSDRPVVAYQFNPLENVDVFSNDASLLLPSSGNGSQYTVVGWPQTIANDKFDPEQDFADGLEDEDLRATLTIVGNEDDTEVTVTFGAKVGVVVGVGDFEDQGPGDTLTFDIDAFDVINLETQKFNGDFTGTLVSTNGKPVSVFIGSEASDAPRFDTYRDRECCADHLEEQLFPNATLGERFVMARMPRRSVALNNAFTGLDNVAEVNEKEWVRVVAVGEGTTEVATTIICPEGTVDCPQNFALEQGEDRILLALQDFEMEATQPIAVLQILPSQFALGIPAKYPGGDPAIIAVPPVRQFRQEYVFLTPDKYAFDFVTLTAPAGADVRLDGESVIGREGCFSSPGDGIAREPGDPEPNYIIHRCQLSFPDIDSVGGRVDIKSGDQDDGVHTVISNQPVGIVVYGFDAFVSYAYAGGLNLDIVR